MLIETNEVGGRVSVRETYRRADAFSPRKGPYIEDVRKIFGILDPLPPCPHFG